MSSKERKPTRDVLSNIDDLLGEETAPPVAFKDVDRLTNIIWNFGTEDEQKELTELKESALDLVKGKAKHFAGFEEFKKVRAEFYELHVEYKKYQGTSNTELLRYAEMKQAGRNVDIKVREYRNRVLTNILATNHAMLPDELKESTSQIQNRYANVYKTYKARKGPNAESL